MRVAVFSAKLYDRSFLSAANERFNHDLVFLEPCLELATAKLAEGFAGVCVFVNDCLDQAVLEQLKGYGATTGRAYVALGLELGSTPTNRLSGDRQSSRMRRRAISHAVPTRRNSSEYIPAWSGPMSVHATQ